MLGVNQPIFHNHLKINVDRAKVNLLLLYKGYNQEQVDIYLKAFDYASVIGATVTKTW
jgi:SOS response regulatory protein OraA/RecX